MTTHVMTAAVSGLSPIDLVSFLCVRDRRSPRPALTYRATDVRDGQLDPSMTSTREKLKTAIRD